MNQRRCAVIVIVGCLCLLLFAASSSDAAWYFDIPGSAEHGGAGRAGPYPTESLAREYRAQMEAQGYLPGPVYGSDDGSSTSSADAMGSGLAGMAWNLGDALGRLLGLRKQREAPPPVALGPQFVPNPVHQQALNELQTHQLPPPVAQQQLMQALQQTAFFGLRPGGAGAAGLQPIRQGTLERGDTAMAQLVLSYRLARKGLESSQSEEFPEQASYLLYESAQALNGGYVEAVGGDGGLPGVPTVQGQPVQISPKYAAAIEVVRGGFVQASALGQQWRAKRDEAAQAQQVLQKREQILQDVQKQLAERASSPQSQEEKERDQSLLQEAQAAAQKAKENLQQAQADAAALEASARQSLESARGAAGKLDQASLDPQKLDEFLGEFNAQAAPQQ